MTRYIYEPSKSESLEELTKVFHKMTGFMMVRHPFVRLVSAYEDKMLNPHPFPYKYHHQIQEKIKKRRTNKKKRINFPKDLLTSQRYKYMLKNKVSSFLIFYIFSINFVPAYNCWSACKTALIPRVCGLAADRPHWILK